MKLFEISGIHDEERGSNNFNTHKAQWVYEKQEKQ